MCWRETLFRKPGGFQIDDQLELGRLLDRKVRRFGTLENLIDIYRGSPHPFRIVDPVGYKPALLGETSRPIDDWYANASLVSVTR